MATGWEMLGSALGGTSEEAYQEGRYRSAQTEDALLQARGRQLNNAAAESKAANRARLEDEAAKAGIENPGLFAALALGEVNPQQFMGGVETQQKIGFRDKIANPDIGFDVAQRNRMALGEAPFSPISPVGSRAAVNVFDPEQKLIPLGDQFSSGEGTSAIRNFEYGQTLPPDRKAAFDAYVRNSQIVNAGGVPVNTGFGGTAPPANVVPTAEVAANAGAIAESKKLGQGMAGRTLDLPMARARLDSSNAKWDSLTGAVEALFKNDSLWQAVGPGRPIALIPGTEGANIRAQLRTIKSKIGFEVLQDMRANSKTGGAVGNVSNAEQEYLQNNLAALDENLSPEDFRAQLQVVIDYAAGAKQRLDDAFRNTYPENFQQQAPAGGLRTFATEAEAEAAGLAPGTRVVIGGVTGTWQ